MIHSVDDVEFKMFLNLDFFSSKNVLHASSDQGVAATTIPIHGIGPIRSTTTKLDRLDSETNRSPGFLTATWSIQEYRDSTDRTTSSGWVVPSFATSNRRIGARTRTRRRTRTGTWTCSESRTSSEWRRDLPAQRIRKPTIIVFVFVVTLVKPDAEIESPIPERGTFAHSKLSRSMSVWRIGKSGSKCESNKVSDRQDL